MVVEVAFWFITRYLFTPDLNFLFRQYSTTYPDVLESFFHFTCIFLPFTAFTLINDAFFGATFKVIFTVFLL